ncbi:hypothetical protein AX15_002121 [Amanita polypyramis BW_CC]|nr:hypothetical protein AX15_002121 [Amanita polypyramis BW_CC]
MDASCYIHMALQDTLSPTRFYPDVQIPAQASTSQHDSYSMGTQGLYPATGPQLAHGIRLVEGENTADSGNNEAMQLANEIMQHKTTIQRIANAFAA